MKKKPTLPPLPKGVIKPEENRKIEFTDIYGNTFKGLYIKDEDMFFIGFGLTGGFRYAFDIHNWTYYEGTI
jgi:hypothetical protein